MSGRRRRGWSRTGRPGRFRYRDARGAPISDERALARIAALTIPPAWTDVWIAPGERARLQATGVDRAGRRQYLYHPDYRAAREQEKFEGLIAFGEALPSLRRHLATDMRRGPFELEWTSALAVTLVNRAWFRPGSERAARARRTYGVTTLTKRHVRVEGSRLRFCFRGKHRVLQRTTLVDDELAQAIRRLLDTPDGGRLLRWLPPEGDLRPLTATLLNDYLRDRFDPRFTVKDFRTWGGTLTASISLAESGPPTSSAHERSALARAYRAVAEQLGNTPAVARASYVSPVVIERYREGTTLADVRPRAKRVLSASAVDLDLEEQALLALLTGSRR